MTKKPPTSYAEELSRLWHSDIERKFLLTPGEEGVAKRVKLAIVEVYEEMKENEVLAYILDCDPGEVKKYYNYPEPVNILSRVASALTLNKRSLSVIFTELDASQEAKKILGGNVSHGGIPFGRKSRI